MRCKATLEILLQGLVERCPFERSKSGAQEHPRTLWYEVGDPDLDDVNDSRDRSFELGLAQPDPSPAYLRKGYWKRFWAYLVLFNCESGDRAGFMVYLKPKSRKAIDRSQFDDQKFNLQCILSPSLQQWRFSGLSADPDNLAQADSAFPTLLLAVNLWLQTCKLLNDSKGVKAVDLSPQVGWYCCDPHDSHSFIVSDVQKGLVFRLRPLPSRSTSQTSGTQETCRHQSVLSRLLSRSSQRPTRRASVGGGDKPRPDPMSSMPELVVHKSRLRLVDPDQVHLCDQWIGVLNTLIKSAQIPSF